MSNSAKETLIAELLKFTERLECLPDKASWVMQAVEALRESRRDPKTAAELESYARTDAEAGLYSEAELLGRATKTLRGAAVILQPSAAAQASANPSAVKMIAIAVLGTKPLLFSKKQMAVPILSGI